MTTMTMRGVLVMVALALIVPSSADAAQTVVSPNWSGYAMTGTETPAVFTRATGTWRVPTVNCPTGSAGASSVVWVGIGGLGGADREVAQIGMSGNCRRAGRPRYHAWFEIAPNQAFRVKRRLLAGDTIHASVNIRPSEVELLIDNETRGWRFGRTITWMLADRSSAEWIVEAPTTCVRHSCGQAPLADFGSVTMTRIAATANSASGTLADPTWTITPIRLVPPGAGLRILGASNPRAGADPSATSADGTAFSVSWIAVAPR